MLSPAAIIIHSFTILFIIILFYLSLETEINIHVVGSAEHVEILRVERLVLLIRFLLILQQAYLFVSAGLDVLVVQQVLHFEAEPEGIRAADVPVLPYACVEHVSLVELLLLAYADDVFRRHARCQYGVGAVWLDRKSTRLNSSHANISYAVFCLKKKKQ